MSDEPAAPRGEETGAPERRAWRFGDHVGVLSGLLLGLVALILLVVLAAAGDPSALAILVVIVIGIALIYLGGKLHGDRRR